MLVTSNYLLVESFVFLRARPGMQAVRAFHDAVLPVLQVRWTKREDQEAARRPA